MELPDAERLALSLMKQYRLLDMGWTFGFDQAVSRLGATWYGKKKITISTMMVKKAKDELIRQTILHEIAHALLPPGVGHGKKWKELATAIGYTGERVSTENWLPDEEVKKIVARRKKRQTTINHKKRQTKQRPTIKPEDSGVGVGDTLFLPDKTLGVVRKAARKYFHVYVKETNMMWKVPFESAKSFKVE
jgi:predicted SprT family Zn-dependent metalloprotease